MAARIEAHVARKGTRPIGESVQRLRADEAAKRPRRYRDLPAVRRANVLALRDRLRGLLGVSRAAAARSGPMARRQKAPRC